MSLCDIGHEVHHENQGQDKSDDRVLPEESERQDDSNVEKHPNATCTSPQDTFANPAASKTPSENRDHEIDLEGQKPKAYYSHNTPLPTHLHTCAYSTLPILSSTSTSSCPPSTTYPEGGLHAYSVVFGSFCAMLAGFGLMNAVGTFQAYLTTHQLSSYSESTVGWIFSLYIFLSFFCGVQIGPVFDTKGPRWLVVAGSVCVVGGVMGIGESTKYWHFILTFSILGGIGTSLLFTPAISAIGHFFSLRRGSATGLAATGGSVGGIVFPLILPKLFSTVGFAWGVRIMGFVLLFLVLIANLLIRSRLPPKVGGSVWPDHKIFGDSVFALTTAGVFFVEWGLFVPLSYISSYALHYGISPTFSYQILAIVNVGSFFGRWIPGYVADRWGRFNTMIMTVVLCLVMVLGVWLPARGNVPATVVFALVFGFASGSNISLTPVCVGQLCETETYGRYYATCYTVVSFGCLTGIPLAGQLLVACNGAYWGLILFTGLCYAVGLACFVAARVIRVGWGLAKVY